ncbi:hypothetical protein GGQ85_003922 [Nitrobacter vulgaris]|nr:hypothetical protein [Nitrobacter vulgaris]
MLQGGKTSITSAQIKSVAGAGARSDLIDAIVRG